ncbi:hypothetical protein Taro_037274 [Colocasia esculenta]|uniref:Uncharacterized protein n=1 Tax=Colocasia esculenta TaxID=4460 RepID=A0A843W994_COLES|nr:hypothetical protein [Colocasia esculenta]
MHYGETLPHWRLTFQTKEEYLLFQATASTHSLEFGAFVALMYIGVRQEFASSIPSKRNISSKLSESDSLQDVNDESEVTISSIFAMKARHEVVVSYEVVVLPKSMFK